MHGLFFLKNRLICMHIYIYTYIICSASTLHRSWCGLSDPLDIDRCRISEHFQSEHGESRGLVTSGVGSSMGFGLESGTVAFGVGLGIACGVGFGVGFEVWRGIRHGI